MAGQTEMTETLEAEPRTLAEAGDAGETAHGAPVAERTDEDPEDGLDDSEDPDEAGDDEAGDSETGDDEADTPAA